MTFYCDPRTCGTIVPQLMVGRERRSAQLVCAENAAEAINALGVRGLKIAKPRSSTRINELPKRPKSRGLGHVPQGQMRNEEACTGRSDAQRGGNMAKISTQRGWNKAMLFSAYAETRLSQRGGFRGTWLAQRGGFRRTWLSQTGS